MSTSNVPQSTEVDVSRKSGVKKFLTVLLLTSLALAGAIVAVLVLVGQTYDTVSNGIITALLIVAADIYIIIGLFTKHLWLRVSIWMFTAFSFILSIVLIWLPSQVGYYCGDMVDSRYEDSGCYYNRNWYDYMTDASYGGHILLSVLGGLGLISLLWNRVKTVAWVRKLYAVTFAVAITAGVLFAVNTSFNLWSYSYDYSGFQFDQVPTALLILAVTGVAIIILTAIFTRTQPKVNAVAPVGAPVGVSHASVETSGGTGVLIDFKSPEAREAWFGFMAEYQQWFSSQPADTSSVTPDGVPVPEEVNEVSVGDEPFVAVEDTEPTDRTLDSAPPANLAEEPETDVVSAEPTLDTELTEDEDESERK